jgi:recombination protein RecT
MSNAMVPKNEMAAVKAQMEKLAPSLRLVATKVLTPEKITKIVTAAISRQPMLLQAFRDSPHSILRCAFAATQLGLDPDSPLGQCYMVPFRNGKNGGKYEAQFIIGYRGLIDLARRSGNIVSIRSRVVHERDEFRIAYGLREELHHVPHEGPDAGELRAVYAVAELKDGGIQYEVMYRHEIDAIKKRSKASQYGPWVTDYAEMARKTVVRRLCKYLPMSVDLARAVEHESSQDSGAISALDLEMDLPQLEAGDQGEIIEHPQPATASEAAGDALLGKMQ